MAIITRMLPISAGCGGFVPAMLSAACSQFPDVLIT
jgi:hypothetical protein